MRQNLRLFVYPLTTKCGKSQQPPQHLLHPAPPMSSPSEAAHQACSKMRSGNRGYWVEGIFYSRALASPLRVENPDAATIFYIPTFTSCWRSQAFRGRVTARTDSAAALRCLGAGRAESGPPESCSGPFGRHGCPAESLGDSGRSCACVCVEGCIPVAALPQAWPLLTILVPSYFGGRPAICSRYVCMQVYGAEASLGFCTRLLPEASSWSGNCAQPLRML